MRNKAPAVCMVLLVSSAFGADKITEDVDRARFGLARSYVNLSRFEEALPILQELRRKYPDHEDILVDCVAILSSKNEYSTAIAMCREYLRRNGESEKIAQWLARCLSWDKQYEESLATYATLIADYPDNDELYRERARVLGWHRQYDNSIEEYARLANRKPNDARYQSELEAKRSLYQRHDMAAMGHYEHWLRVEPGNVEALYDLAQIYSRQGLWRKAEKAYGDILKKHSTHFRARQALKKVRQYSQGARLEGGLDYFKAFSSGRLTNTRVYNSFLSIGRPVTENVFLTFRQDNLWYAFKDHGRAYHQRGGVEVEYSGRPDFWASAHVSSDLYDARGGVEPLFGGEAHWKPHDTLQFDVSHQRQRVIDNGLVFLDGLYRDQYRTSLLFQPIRGLTGACEYAHAAYSDGNDRDLFGADVSYSLEFDSDDIKVSYRYETYGFARNEPDYFSPGGFHSNRVRGEWRHYLNQEELFWGSDQTYFTVRYDLILDVGRQIGHKLGAGLHHDWNDRFNTRVEWSKTIYEHEDIYGEDRFMVSMTLHF
jgi:tetratricopeptide (TPR) repeat protein